ncbi:magnesium transporter CorA family protein [Paenibacillus glycanilyticus]|uniref:magnesium transporter CorA family protein n=1 Tax=Paenibacillus glycanilyticus TaxID=126569 RepID=UPI0020417C6A|nr:magnesium transporter CorA family protein [Paenibacillus glycanilyticus]MCM3630933.1 magnesium transporter CorA family protein [Paenibacillus glycanilyticus]
MIHRMLRYPAKWEWHVLQLERPPMESAEELPKRKDNRKKNETSKASMTFTTPPVTDEDFEEQLSCKRLLPECASWLDDCWGKKENQIAVKHSAVQSTVVSGTLMLQASEQTTDVQPFYFWLMEDKIVTLHTDLRFMIRLQDDTITSRLNNCASAPEALFIMLGHLLGPFHQGLDGFEKRLGELEQSMRISNRTGLLDVIFERRYDLLHWSHQFIPIRELYGAAQEAFMDKLTDTEVFKRTTYKLDRIESLLKHYALEIDTLISMDDALSSFRGNDIMKTLTIFTVIFTPATVIGALWGTNFNPLPWDNHRLGFIGMCVIILIVTLLIYLWLWQKGWTGDLLTGRSSKKQSRILMLDEPLTANSEPEPPEQELSRHSRKRRSKTI